MTNLLTPAEMAELFNVVPSTLRDWDRAGKLAHAGIRVTRTPAGHRRYNAADVERYLEQQDGGQS